MTFCRSLCSSCPTPVNDELSILAHLADAVEIPGDIILGGLFPIHKKSVTSENECGVFSETPGYHFMEAMLYAIDKVNKNPNILRNITLGATVYDTCQSKTIAADRAKGFISTSLSSNSKVQLAGVIGALSSGVSETVANFLRVFEIPQISYSSTSTILSNKDIYSYFLRTVPPDSFQAQAMVDIIRRYGWSYVSTVNSAGTYGTKGIDIFRKTAKENGICIGVTARLTSFPSSEEYADVIDRLQSTDRQQHSNVVVVFGTQTDIRNLLEADMKKYNGSKHRHLTWIGSDGWSNRVDVTNTAQKAALGALTIMMRRGETSQEFKNYFANLSMDNYPRENKRFFKELLESRFPCEVVGTNESYEKYNMSCYGRNLQDDYIEISPVRVVINAVNAFAHAIDSLQQELCPNQLGICDKMKQFERSRLLEHLKNVSFPDSSVNATITFDENYEVSAMYDIMNFRKVNGTPRYVRVGTWDGQKIYGRIESKLVFDKSIKWLHGVKSAPESYCSQNCSRGERRVRIPLLDFRCCWECTLCDSLQIVLNNTCRSGPIGWMPNANGTGWVKRELVYPKWNSSVSILLVLISLLSLVLTMLTVLVYIVFKDNRLLKASGRELCFVMLVGIGLCFIVPFLYIAKPKDGLCHTRGLIIGLALAMCYAPLFMKINRIYRIFTSARSSVARPALVTPHMQLLITLGLIIIQLMFTALWFIAKPVRATESYVASTEELLLECNVDELSFSVNLCYVMILMFLCTAYAFKTRNFPKNFNESKYIGITMYITCAVWMVFFPFYLNTGDRFLHTYLISSACVIIGLVTLIGLFAQKVYIVFYVKAIRNDDLVLGTSSTQKEPTMSAEGARRCRNAENYTYVYDR